MKMILGVGLSLWALTGRCWGADAAAGSSGDPFVDAIRASEATPVPMPEAVRSEAVPMSGPANIGDTKTAASISWTLSEAVSLRDKLRRDHAQFDDAALAGRWELTAAVADSMWVPRRLAFKAAGDHLSLFVDGRPAETTYGPPGSGPALGPTDYVHYDWVKGPGIHYKAMGLSCYHLDRYQEAKDILFCEMDASTIWFWGKQVDPPDSYYLLYSRKTPQE